MSFALGDAVLAKSMSFGSSLSLHDLLDPADAASRETQRAVRRRSMMKGEKMSLTAGGDGDGPAPGMNFTLMLTVFVVTIGSSFQFGFGTGIMNNSKEFIMGYFHDQGKEYTTMQWGITVSMFGVGGLIGAVLGPKVIGHYCGRKTTLLINNIFIFISSYLIAFGTEWYWLALGRVFTGIVAGVGTAVVPTYFSEISPIDIRGAIGTMHQLGITIGILVAQALSTPSLHLLGSEDLWQWLFLVPALCGLLELLILPFMPESPPYLFKTHSKEAARAALARLQSPEKVDEYMGYIEQEVSVEAESSGKSLGIWALFGERSLRKQLIVGITVQLMMQFSGIDAVFYYSTTVFYEAEVSDPELATTALGLINVIITIFAVKLMDSAGRKTLLTYSWVGMCLSFLVLTISFILKPYSDAMNTVAVLATTGVIIFFAFGPGCIAWFIIAEIFPLYARDTAMAIGIFINWVANWLVAFTFPLLLASCQPYTFLIFVTTTGFFLFFTLNFVPETKGRTVAEIDKVFETIPVCTC